MEQCGETSMKRVLQDVGMCPHPSSAAGLGGLLAGLAPGKVSWSSAAWLVTSEGSSRGEGKGAGTSAVESWPAPAAAVCSSELLEF